MSGFSRDQGGVAELGGTPIAKLLDQAAVSTPAYLYDLDGIAEATRGLIAGFGSAAHVVAYAVKANTAGSVVRTVAAAGGGADVVSGAELQVALASGISPERVVMSGVAKQDHELDLAITRGILGIQLESVEEIARVAARARAVGAKANVSVRVNPDVEIDSHAHIATGHDEAKFGIVQNDLPAAFSAIAQHTDHLSLVGISTHVGSMLRTPASYLESAEVVCRVAKERRAAGAPLRFVDFGGGYGIDYGGAPVDPPAAFARAYQSSPSPMRRSSS